MTKVLILYLSYFPQLGDKKIKPVESSTGFENYKNTQPTLPDINNRKLVKVFGIFKKNIGKILFVLFLLEKGHFLSKKINLRKQELRNLRSLLKEYYFSIFYSFINLIFMKRFLLFFLLIPQFIQAQNLYSTRLDTNDFYQVYFPSSQLGFIIGENGTMLKTEDAGSSWFPVSLELKDSVGLRDMVFIDDTLGFATGDKASLIQTLNGGLSWMEVPVDESGPLGTDFGGFYAVSFFNEQVGWIAGDNGEIQSTIDGGMAWERKELSSTERVVDVYALTDTSALALVQSGQLFYTENLGEVWEEAYPFEDSLGENPMMFAMFGEDNFAYAAGAPGSYSSPYISFLDEIATDWMLWQEISNPIVAVDSIHPFFTDMHFVDRDSGWVVGWDKLILYTKDKGQNWTQLPSPDTVTNELNGVTLTRDSMEVWIVGNDGLAISTRPFPIPIGIEPEIHRSFTVFPNPNNGNFYIQNPFTSPREAISTVYDLQGRLVHKQAIVFSSQAQQAVKMPALEEGIYILHMHAEGELFQPQKLIVRPRP